MGVFVISSTLNYLDRTLLNTLAPLILKEFHMDQIGFGYLISAFSITYAVSTLGAGWVLDRFGVNRGMMAAVGWWSAAAIGTGLSRSFGGLALARGALGLGESAGVPAVGKLNGIYLKPEERALGAAVNQIGLSLAAPVGALFVGFAITHTWRSPFMISGALGFVWIPVWLLVSRLIPPRFRSAEFVSREERQAKSAFALLSDKNLLLLVAANVLWMGGYSLWSNWLTLYLTHVHNVSLADSAKYVWIPPLISNLGGFFGGWLSLRWMRRSVDSVSARRRAVWVSAAGCSLTLLVPLAPTASWATALISVSFFFLLAGSVNIYTLPIDIFGAQRAGLAISALTFGYGLLQTVISPIIGYLNEHHLYTQVVWLVTAPVLLSALLLSGLKSNTENPKS